ncbi:MAG: transcription-repair coupling factor, partial [Candidatus Aminicenantes bacterium]|nr:transcription-repair coupling factor [Candidatus Aminicenantes bacterium]
MSLDFLKETKEFKELLRALKQGETGLSISGLIQPAKPYFLSSLVQESTKRIIFIRPSTSSLSRFEEQCRFFLSQCDSDKKTNFLPPLSENPYQEIFPALESVSSRMRFFYDLLYDPPSLIITNPFGLLKPFPNPKNLKQLFLSLEKGHIFGRDLLLKTLSEYGYTKEDLINSHGEYAWRGGIVDVFSPWQEYPYRIEFSGDRIVSLREFEPFSQRSMRKIDRLIFPSLRESPGSSQIFCEWEKPELFVPFKDYLEDSLFVIDDIEEVEKDWEQTLKDYREQHEELKAQQKFSPPPEKIYPPRLWEQIKHKALRLTALAPPAAKKTFHFPFQSVPRFENKIPFFLQYMKKIQEERERCFIYFSTEGVLHKLASLLSQHQILSLESSTPFFSPKDGAVALLVGNLGRGFSFPREKIAYFSEKDIFTEEKVLVSRPRIKPFVSHFQDLKSNDHVVHTDYGIGIFNGLVKMDVDKKNREFIEILYRDDDKLFVPVENLNLVQKYAKLGTRSPLLSKLGTPTWERVKARAKKAVENLAKELLHLYARRKAVTGHSYSPAGTWQSEFEQTFE